MNRKIPTLDLREREVSLHHFALLLKRKSDKIGLKKYSDIAFCHSAVLLDEIRRTLMLEKLLRLKTAE